MEAKAAPGTVELTARHCPAQLGKDREQEPSALSLQTLLPNLITSLMKAFDFLGGRRRPSGVHEAAARTEQGLLFPLGIPQRAREQCH